MHDNVAGGAAAADSASTDAADMASSSASDAVVEVVHYASAVVQGDDRTDAEGLSDTVQDTVRFKRSRPDMRDREGWEFEAAIAVCFSFGRGGPSQKERVHLSETEFMRRFMYDGHCELAQNELLLVHAFDRAAHSELLR